MRSKIQYFIFLVAIFSSALLVTSLASAQKKVTKPAHPAKLAPAAISVSGSTIPGVNTAEEQEHCFKAAPGSDLVLTISSADINRPLPKNGVVTVEIINLSLLDTTRTNSLSKPDVSPDMKYELAAATINKLGYAKVIFPGDANKASAGPRNTTIHLGSLDPMEVPVTTPYSNVALITISNPRNTANMVEPVKYVYAYQVWTKNPSECAQKP
jgi:hypothetical protein